MAKYGMRTRWSDDYGWNEENVVEEKIIHTHRVTSGAYADTYEDTVRLSDGRVVTRVRHET